MLLFGIELNSLQNSSVLYVLLFEAIFLTEKINCMSNVIM